MDSQEPGISGVARDIDASSQSGHVEELVVRSVLGRRYRCAIACRKSRDFKSRRVNLIHGGAKAASLDQVAIDCGDINQGPLTLTGYIGCICPVERNRSK